MGLRDRLVDAWHSSEYIKNFGVFKAYVDPLYQDRFWQETDLNHDILEEINSDGIRTFENNFYREDFIEISREFDGYASVSPEGTEFWVKKTGEDVKFIFHLIIIYIPFSSNEEYEKNKDKIIRIIDENKIDNKTLQIKHERLNNAHIVIKQYNVGYSKYYKKNIIYQGDMPPLPKIIENSAKSAKNNRKGNFQYLNQLIHSGSKEIILDSNITLDKKEKRDFSEGIHLDVDDLVIDGNGHTIDARGKTRIFYSIGKNLTLKNLTLKNAFSNVEGGAIYKLDGKITLKECKFLANKSKKGGAIYFEGEEIVLEKCEFVKNNAQKGAGAIVNKGRKIIIDDSTFEGNKSLNFAGAVNTGEEAIIKKSTFKQNKGGSGGAIAGVEMIIEESVFAGNKSDAHGGAINGGNLTIRDSTFTNNSGKIWGGAISCTNLTVKNSTFSGNKVKGEGDKGKGGAIHVKSHNIIDCDFKKNKPDDVYESNY